MILKNSIKKFYKVNQAINAKTVRLVGPGVNEITTLEEALKKARAVSKDLIEIGPNSDPPVVKVIEFKKFLFEERKKEKKAEKTKSAIKELRFSPVIAENDLMIRINRGREFLAAGYQLRLTIRFRGREISHPEVGIEKLKKIKKLLEENGKASGPERWLGPNLTVTYLPLK